MKEPKSGRPTARGAPHETQTRWSVGARTRPHLSTQRSLPGRQVEDEMPPPSPPQASRSDGALSGRQQAGLALSDSVLPHGQPAAEEARTGTQLAEPRTGR